MVPGRRTIGDRPLARLAQDRRLAVVLDEFPYAVEAEPACAPLPRDIAAASGVPRFNLPRYLETLRDLHLVERQVPVTERRPDRSRRGLYRLGDNYLNFYFRFVAPYREDLEQGYLDRAWQAIDRQLNAFVGATAFESLCRQWIRRRGREGHLPFVPEQVGSYWDRQTQVDVVGLNWSQQLSYSPWADPRRPDCPPQPADVPAPLPAGPGRRMVGPPGVT